MNLDSIDTKYSILNSLKWKLFGQLKNIWLQLICLVALLPKRKPMATYPSTNYYQPNFQLSLRIKLGLKLFCRTQLNMKTTMPRQNIDTIQITADFGIDPFSVKTKKHGKEIVTTPFGGFSFNSVVFLEILSKKPYKN